MVAATVNGAVAGQLGHNLLKARRRAGFTQEELGERALVHRTHIGYIELGQRLPRIDTIIKIAWAVGTGIEELVEGIEWVVPAPSRLGHFLVSPTGGGSA